MVAILDNTGARVESARYSVTGVPFGIHPRNWIDINGDGVRTTSGGADQTLLTAAMNTSVGDAAYNVAADFTLRGTISTKEQDDYNAAGSPTLGFGMLTRKATGNRKGYAGYEHNIEFPLDALAHVRHRAYEAHIGRWVQRDPLGFVDGPNLYGYVRGNPVGMVDPSGLQTLTCPGCPFGGIIEDPDGSPGGGGGGGSNPPGGGGGPGSGIEDPGPPGSRTPVQPDPVGNDTTVNGPFAATLSSVSPIWPATELPAMIALWTARYGTPPNAVQSAAMSALLASLLETFNAAPPASFADNNDFQNYREHRGFVFIQPQLRCRNDIVQRSSTFSGSHQGYTPVRRQNSDGGIITTYIPGDDGPGGTVAQMQDSSLTPGCRTWILRDSSRVTGGGAPLFDPPFGDLPFVWREVKYTLCCNGSYTVTYSGSDFPDQSSYFNHNLRVRKRQGPAAQFLFHGPSQYPGGQFDTVSGQW